MIHFNIDQYLAIQAQQGGGTYKYVTGPYRFRLPYIVFLAIRTLRHLLTQEQEAINHAGPTHMHSKTIVAMKCQLLGTIPRRQLAEEEEETCLVFTQK